MKTLKYILFCFVLLSSVFILNNINAQSDITNEQHSCDCDYCRKFHKSSDEETYNNYYYRVMSSKDFSDFRKLINDRTFESTKMEMAKSVIGNNYFSTGQVREMLGWFVFESNKLELAKIAFTRTADWQKYYKLYDIFTFESSVTELDEYIKGQKM